MIQYPRAVEIESRGRGLLDTRVRGYDGRPAVADARSPSPDDSPCLYGSLTQHLRAISFVTLLSRDGAAKKHPNNAMARLAERGRVADRELDRDCGAVAAGPRRRRGCGGCVSSRRGRAAGLPRRGGTHRA